MWGIALGVASSVLGGLQAQEDVKAQNTAKRLQWEFNKELTQEALSTLSYRTQVAESEVVRDRIARNIAINQAAKKAEGEAAVSAAQIGAAGRRVELSIERDTKRKAADAVSESNVNAQIAFNNVTNYFTDTATRMIDNLNSARPTYGEPPSTGEILLNAGMGALGQYASMSTDQRAGVKDTFSNLMNSIEPKQEFRPKDSAAHFI